MEPLKHVFVCHWGKVCPTKGSQDLVGPLRDMIDAKGLSHQIQVTKSGCLDYCEIGPNMVVYPEGTWYSGVQIEDLREIVESHLINGQPVKRLLTPRTPGTHA